MNHYENLKDVFNSMGVTYIEGLEVGDLDGRSYTRYIRLTEGVVSERNTTTNFYFNNGLYIDHGLWE